MEILSKLGLSLGRDLKKYPDRQHFEHVWFQEVNRKILGAIGYPYPWIFKKDRSKILNKFLKDGGFLKKTKTDMFKQMKSEGIKEDELWGFKDPRTCLSFPVWHKICPNGKFLFLDRHPKDTINRWHGAGTKGYPIFRKYFEENIEMAKKADSDYFVLSYELLSNEWTSTIKKVMDWLQLHDFSKIEGVKSLWNPIFEGKIRKVSG